MLKAKIWEEEVVIPTYKVYPPEEMPLFLEKRAYQGSTGKVYPLPVTEKISDEKEDVVYQAVFLENEYLKVMVLPQLGGRIQRAYDKTNGYDFVYYNHVIKPALVGLLGPWISGGIEFNWPQHHRPSTFMPVDCCLHENDDGSVSAFLSEIDRMHGTKGMTRISLYPGKAYIEIEGQLYNPTDLAETFLWWANPAVPVNDHTYSVFPPDVNAVMDHGKRAVSSFPIATGEYYKYDYSEGVDISRYKNIYVPTSYMAAASDYDFVGQYDENVGAGLLHVADHHISPGKKQWTWGRGDFGKAWDRNLTDSDGPYIELMTGVYADNQPDFTWLKPGEEKTFKQYFMPYKGVGRVGNATRDAIVSFTSEEEGTLLHLYTTAEHQNLHVLVNENDTVILDTQVDTSPRDCLHLKLEGVRDPGALSVSVQSGSRELVSDTVYQQTLKPLPRPMDPLSEPKEMKSLEELYLAAKHLEQYRHATVDPAPYYEEGLRRDPTDIRLNDGYGCLKYRRGQIEESLPYFEAAIKKQTWRNPNPYSGEVYYHDGLALKGCGRMNEAYDAFYKAVWSQETQEAAFYQLALIDACRGNDENALEFARKALVRNWHDLRTRHLIIILLRKLHQVNTDFIQESEQIDPLYMGIIYEKFKIRRIKRSSFLQAMREDQENYLTLSRAYMRCGMYEDASDIVEAAPRQSFETYAYYSYCKMKNGQQEEAVKAAKKAEEAPHAGSYPSHLIEVEILQCVVRLLDRAPKAHTLLGDLYYDQKQYEKAVREWEQAAAEEPLCAEALRNLSIAYFNKRHDPEKAFHFIENACAVNPDYPRLLLEYDQLAARLPLTVKERLNHLQENITIVKERDDLYLRYISLLNASGRYQEALSAIEFRQFHPWEGGEGKVSTQYKYALIHLAREKEAENPQEALELLKQTLVYPHNLGEGKLFNVPDHEAYYEMGLIYRQMDDETQAAACFEKASSGSCEPEPVLYYNDQPSDYIYYQGLAFRALGDESRAKKSFHQLIHYGEQHIFDDVRYDFFAVSLPEIEVYQDDIALRNTQYCNYLRALGALGLGQIHQAKSLFEEILVKQPDHLNAISFMKNM